ncbi:NlpC/P60 family protein [Streptomyces sp. NPDC021224]|uniref:NlpC/P60 family protein n=1 Tax=unclassified Streptomyces TaxID=2593676 RepID=UPI0037AE3F32
MTRSQRLVMWEDTYMPVARNTRSWQRSAAVCSALLATAALSLNAGQSASARPYEPPPAPPATTPPTTPTATLGSLPTPGATADPDSLPQLLTQLQTLYQQSEAATESYNQAKVTADQQRTKARALDGQLATARAKVAAGKDQVGLLARQLYRTGGLSPYIAMLGGEDPQDFFGNLHLAQHTVETQQAAVDSLTAEQDRLTGLNAQAQKALDAAQTAQNTQAAKKTEIETNLRQVESLLAGLSGVQISELEALEQQGADKAQQEFMDSKPLGRDAAVRAPSAKGDAAIAYAFAQLGKPYVWGAVGPDSYDCSGLTSQAWGHAGVPIPRTAEEQWAKLPRVPLSLLRPGDLVVYFPKATHVALYIGNGLVVQAPHTGSYVKISPIGANPVLGAVRPDMGAQPLAHYKPRKVPAVKVPAAAKTAKTAKSAASTAPGKAPASGKGTPAGKSAATLRK